MTSPSGAGNGSDPAAGGNPSGQNGSGTSGGHNPSGAGGSGGASSSGSEGRAGRDLEREDLEKALAAARDEAYSQRQKAKFAFPDEESFRRATEALSMLEKAENDRKSEVERLSEDKEKLLYRAAQAEGSATRLRVALAAGIPSDRIDEFASRLRGNTEDELKADAAELAKLFTPAAPARRGDPSQGAGSGAPSAVHPLQAELEARLGLSR